MVMSDIPAKPDAGGNPLVALAIAVIHAILYVLNSIRAMVTWLTITLPSMIVRMLQYSFTISLGFPTLLSLFFTCMLALFFLIRYRYLARYTQLKEPALPQPSPPSLTTELLPLDLTGNDKSRSSIHNYLDDFLSAIRIFGYLEKPVFHELSRHLQTRRLAAGDTIEIGGGEFWCVMEGKVQVFAPSSDDSDSPASPSQGSFPTSNPASFNGYHLLNEVSTGGTLSSLFSILSLFTEDIKLSWTPPNEDALGAGEDEEEGDITLTSRNSSGDMLNMGDASRGRGKPRQNSDVSQLGEGGLGRRVMSPDALRSAVDEEEEDGPRRRTSSLDSRQSTLMEGSDISASTSAPVTKAPSPILYPGDRPLRTAASFTSPRPRKHPQNTLRPFPSAVEDPPVKTARPRKVKTENSALKGTIARAKVDTTLAVIPAEAFRKLTKKYPKASGTVVQVVLERFSRVTFMTAHKFLGLTREILRSESSLNTLVSHPLPTAFYAGGGMQALRERFQPDTQTHGGQTFQSTTSSPNPGVTSKDYFNFEPTSPTVKAPSLPSFTPHATTPAATAGFHRNTAEAFGMTQIEPEVSRGVPAINANTAAALSPDTAVRHSAKFVRRASAMRKQVAAGDLAMSSSNGMTGNGGAYYRPSARTPGLPRMDTWRGQSNNSWTDFSAHTSGVPIDEADDTDAEAEFELRDAVLQCIARSIGLSQPIPESNTEGTSHAPSVSAFSTPNSPMFPPNTNRPSSRSAFGNVLDMMNASSHNDNLIGGMLREAVHNARMGDGDEASSVSASVQESGMGASGFQDGKGVLRDLEGNVEILYFKKGSILVKEGEKSPGIYYVVDGFLEVSLPVRGSGNDTPRSSGAKKAQSGMANGRPFGVALGLVDPEERSKSDHPFDIKADEQLFEIKPGGIAGYLASLCGTESYVNITAKTDCFVGYLPYKALQKIIERRPIVLLTLSKRLLSLLSPLVLHIDAALDWMQLSGGQVLYEKGDKSSDFYIVINGRLRSLDERDSTVQVIREYGLNDSIGELDVITAVPRSDTVHAIRDSELVRIPAALYDAISARHPATTVQFMRLIAGRVRRAIGEAATAGRNSGGGEERTTDVNLKTVCILGTSRNVPVGQFAGKLKTSLEELGASTSYLDQGTVMRHLGRHAFSRIGKLKVAGWLADQEQHYKTVLYVADTPASSQWTLTCIRQADLVLIIGMGDDPAIGDYERLLLASKTTARKELILLHDDRAVPPGSTRPWLRNRPWLHAHYHVELPGVVTPQKSVPTIHDPAAIAAFKHLRERVETRLKKYRALRPFHRPRQPPHLNDFARIARRLCGRQIGLVLGGGGARGISHIGMLQALEEFGIPIDSIGGCSIGSFVGGLYARGTDLLETTGRTKQFAGRMGSMWRILSDVTYPFVAYTTGHEFNRGIYKAFYNTHIEDFWIPFFANSTNITHSRMDVHRTGYAWRYVRASMTLAGLLPPLSDNGNLLVDGGYMDNTPIGPLRTSGIRDIIVVDVGSVDDTSPRFYGDSVSGWWIFINKFNPFYRRNVLSMTEISSRLAYVSSIKTLEDVKTDPHCLYLAMPVQEYDTLGGFKQFSEILAVGVKTGRETLKSWKEDGKLPSGLVDDVKGAKAIQRGNRLRRMSI